MAPLQTASRGLLSRTLPGTHFGGCDGDAPALLGPPVAASGRRRRRPASPDL